MKLKHKLTAEIGSEGAFTRLSKDKCVFVCLSLGFKIQLMAYFLRFTVDSCSNNLNNICIMFCLEETLEVSCNTCISLPAVEEMGLTVSQGLSQP